ncbi:SDR family NAD(P)-dependent oxidoreductase [Amycolatopsis sp. CA-230715]|uniref:SDR family NAD(P)-dependent oxidoreductase n=1 Tax=Amycolatopsis sp. CA-230715 TaxID=2745196 RepID=UPI001C01D650|nr:SDR family oxidoreductase [Amycolatopsis sp. CA-230715]QWF84493.1 3-oxoacyl-[acyl-carrier-protein] reductase FabG [Amycolatopsis sp. CA-230715]
MPVALVSGGTKGIGLSLSRRLRKIGYRVVALYRSDEGSAVSASEELGAENFEAVRADVSNPRDARRIAARVLEAHGAVTVLVNNAGLNIDRPFLALADDEWDKVIATNLSGPFYLTSALAPAMLDAGGGSVVNVGATTAIRPRRDGANYCASKAGLMHLTKCLALELAPTIRVNSLIPGMIETAEMRTRFRLDEPERMAGMLDEIPQRRIGSPEEMADALEFLIGPAGAYVTGQKLIVDGGQFMW